MLTARSRTTARFGRSTVCRSTSCSAELITDGRASTVDLAPFRASRFAEGELWRDAFDYGLEHATISR